MNVVCCPGFNSTSAAWSICLQRTSNIIIIIIISSSSSSIICFLILLYVSVTDSGINASSKLGGRSAEEGWSVGRGVPIPTRRRQFFCFVI